MYNICIDTNLHTYTYTHIHIYIYTYIHIYIHMYTCMNAYIEQNRRPLMCKDIATIECVLLLLNVFSYYRMCSYTLSRMGAH